MPQDQIVNFEGTEHHFPPDFTQQDIARALAQAHPAPTPLPPVHQSILDRVLDVGKGVLTGRYASNPFPENVQGGYSPLEEFVLGGMMPTPAGPAVGAMAKEATAAAKAAPYSKIGSIVGGGLGYGAGQTIGHPIAGAEAGAAVGGAAPKIKAGVKGALAGLRKYKAPPEVPPIDYTMGSGELSIPGVGPRPPQPPPPAPMPGWTGVPAAHGPIAPVEPLTVYGPTPPPVEHVGLPKIEPVQPEKFGLVPPVSERLPVKGVHLPEVPEHYAGEPNPTAAHQTDLDTIRELRKNPKFDPKNVAIEDVQAARKASGHRPLAQRDIERRLGHLRTMLGLE